MAKKYAVIFFASALLLVPSISSAKALTQGQIGAIIQLLIAFNVDAVTIAKVEKSLGGQASGTTTVVPQPPPQETHTPQTNPTTTSSMVTTASGTTTVVVQAPPQQTPVPQAANPPAVSPASTTPPTAPPPSVPPPPPTPPPPSVASTILEDNFDSYALGSVVGQGGWKSYVNGQNFVISTTSPQSGTKVLYNRSLADSVATKAGNLVTDGTQAVHVRTENRSKWSPYSDGNAQVRVSRGSWASGAPGLAFAAVSFNSDGNVAFYDGLVYRNFAAYEDNQWTLLEIEWRASDTSARYRVNHGAWTDWHPFQNGALFAGFDHVGFDFVTTGGGGVYFDTLE